MVSDRENSAPRPSAGALLFALSPLIIATAVLLAVGIDFGSVGTGVRTVLLFAIAAFAGVRTVLMLVRAPKPERGTEG